VAVEVFGWQGATREQPSGRPARPGGGDRGSNAVQTGTSAANLGDAVDVGSVDERRDPGVDRFLTQRSGQLPACLVAGFLE